MHEHLWKPLAGVAAPACAPVRARRAECASRKKSPTLTGAVFVLTAQALELLQENPCGYGARVSGATIYSYVNGDPLSTVDPTGEYGVVGAVVGAAIDIGWQMMVDGKSLKCVNIGSVLTSATIGALTPGMLALSLEAKAAYPAVKALQSQLPRAMTFGRRAKIQSRIDEHLTRVTDMAGIQGSLGAVGMLIKKGSAEKPWTWGSECECQKK